MPIHMSGNYIFVGPGQKHYVVASNFTNYFEIGTRSVTAYYLEGRIENNEFIVNGRLFVPGCNDWCEIRNNMPTGGLCTKIVTPHGYRIDDSSGNTILELSAPPNGLQCIVSGKIFDSNGEIVAAGDSAGLNINRGPAVIGKSGNARGIVVGAG